MKYVVALLALFCGCFVATNAQSLKFKYDPHLAAGVRGEITIKYQPPKSTNAVITVNLDFSRVSQHGLRGLDPSCRGKVREYEWHIHTKWTSEQTSASLDQCSKQNAGNHYDPGKACGLNSEFADLPVCRGRTSEYHCTPTRYVKDTDVCEKGDLSGKLGRLILDRHGRVYRRWVDPNFPTISGVSDQWNILLHPVCGNTAPRLACAVIQRE